MGLDTGESNTVNSKCQSKRCTKCGVVKDVSSFHKKSDSKDGHASACKNCKSAQDLEYRIQNYTNLQWLTKEANRAKRDRPTDEGVFMCGLLLGRHWIFK